MRKVDPRPSLDHLTSLEILIGRNLKRAKRSYSVPSNPEDKAYLSQMKSSLVVRNGFCYGEQKLLFLDFEPFEIDPLGVIEHLTFFWRLIGP